MSQSMKLTDVLEKIHQAPENDAALTVADVVEALEDRGYGPLLLAASLLTVLPTGAIPGIPTLTAILIILIAAQILVGRTSPWLPQFLRERNIKKQKFEQAREQAEPYTKKFDSLLEPRLEILISRTGLKIVAAICILLALSMPFLELVPFAAFLPAIAIAIMSVGLTARDGYALIAGFIVAGLGMMISGYLLL